MPEQRLKTDFGFVAFATVPFILIIGIWLYFEHGATIADWLYRFIAWADKLIHGY